VVELETETNTEKSKIKFSPLLTYTRGNFTELKTT